MAILAWGGLASGSLEEGPQGAGIPVLYADGLPGCTGLGKYILDHGCRTFRAAISAEGSNSGQEVRESSQEKEALEKQYAQYQEKLHASFIKEKAKFRRAMEKNSQDMQEAADHLTQARQMIYNVVVHGEKEVLKSAKAEDTSKEEWDRMTTEWAKEEEPDFRGVVQRAMEEAKAATPRTRTKTPRSPSVPPGLPSPDMSDRPSHPREAPPGDGAPHFGNNAGVNPGTAGPPAPRVSPRHPGQREPGLRTPTNQAPPRSSVKAATMTGPDKPQAGGHLGSKLDKKREDVLRQYKEGHLPTDMELDQDAALPPEPGPPGTATKPSGAKADRRSATLTRTTTPALATWNK